MSTAIEKRQGLSRRQWRGVCWHTRRMRKAARRRLRAELQGAIFEVLRQDPRLPFTDAGVEIVQAAIEKTLAEYADQGFVTLPLQPVEIKGTIIL